MNFAPFPLSICPIVCIGRPASVRQVAVEQANLLHDTDLGGHSSLAHLNRFVDFDECFAGKRAPSRVPIITFFGLAIGVVIFTRIKCDKDLFRVCIECHLDVAQVLIIDHHVAEEISNGVDVQLANVIWTETAEENSPFWVAAVQRVEYIAFNHWICDWRGGVEIRVECTSNHHFQKDGFLLFRVANLVPACSFFDAKMIETPFDFLHQLMAFAQRLLVQKVRVTELALRFLLIRSRAELLSIVHKRPNLVRIHQSKQIAARSIRPLETTCVWTQIPIECYFENALRR